MSFSKAKMSIFNRLNSSGNDYQNPYTYLTEEEIPHAQRVASEFRKEYGRSSVSRMDSIEGNLREYGGTPQYPKDAKKENAVSITACFNR